MAAQSGRGAPADTAAVPLADGRSDDHPEEIRQAGGTAGIYGMIFMQNREIFPLYKTSSAVRLTHIPTGIIVACQTERSQFQNKDTALKMLKSKLLNLKEKEQKDTIDELKGIQMDIAWGSQIRSYVFCPYTLVKDHRTNYEVGNVQAVMDGELDDFIDSYLKWNVEK